MKMNGDCTRTFYATTLSDFNYKDTQYTNEIGTLTEVELIQTYLRQMNASKLLNLLSSEGERWRYEISAASVQKSKLAGDVLLSSA